MSFLDRIKVLHMTNKIDPLANAPGLREELTAPEVVGNAEKLPPETVSKTSKAAKDLDTAEITFEKKAKEKGWVKIDEDSQIMFKISILSFVSMAIMIWAKWYVDSVKIFTVDEITTSNFIWDYALFVSTLYTTALMFTQVVIGRVVRYLQEQAKKKGLIE
jgi:hypothetical protein